MSRPGNPTTDISRVRQASQGQGRGFFFCGGSDGELALMDGVMLLCWGYIGNMMGYDGT